MRILELNHVALHVKDVAASCKFYENILTLPSIPRPAFDFPGAWFSLGSVQQLHLIGEREASVHNHPQGNHFALRVSSVQEVAAELQSKNISFMGPQQRPDGKWQLFLQDPDGYVIELTELPD